MKKTTNIKALVLALSGIELSSLSTTDALANPQDGQVVAGSATITQETPNKVDITQATDKAIIDWNSFSINANEHTQFHQPSAGSVTLNRVVGEDPSQILGRLTANGQVFLVNPNGIYFGKNAQIDVAGLVASTHNIRNEDFLAGRYNFNIPGKPGAAVINEGTINIADTGIAAFVAPSAANRGVIVAKLGRVVLAAANGFTLDFHGDELLTFLVDDEVAKTAFDLEGKQLTSFVENAGRIEAQGGYVLLSAKAAENAIHSVINQSGVIEAVSVGQQNGEIVLSGGAHGLASNTGILDASGKHAGETGGKIQITGEKIGLFAGTQIDVSGDQGGGKAVVGGDYLGGQATDEQLSEIGMMRESKEIPTATDVQMTQGAVIKADALSSGNGGKVVVWADSELVFDGQISSKGGAASGNGGRVETSGKEKLLANGSVNASAANGLSGLWFMDPLDAIIANSGGTLSASSISSSLNSGTNVTIASDTGARPGSITVLSDITKTAGGDTSLNLFSDGAIVLNRGGRVISTHGKLNVNINARYNVANPTYGLVAIGNDNDYAIFSNGGNVDVEGLIQTYQGKAVATSGGAFRARTTPAVQSGSNPQSDTRGFIGIGPTPINDPNVYTIDTGSGDISMRATGGTITLDNHALATRGTATLTAANVLAQPNILSFNMADEASRQNIERGLGGTLGYGANFPANDDNSTPVDISLLSSSQGLTVLGKNFGNNVYLSNNGYMRLDRGDGTYTPYPLTNTSNPIVAAYFGDVDTRNGIGNVYYGTLATNSNNKAVLTWVNAGYYSLGADKRNTFQLQLENLGQEINMRMSYDQLQWTTGSASGGSGGLGGIVARAGFSIPGTNQTAKFELPASGSQNSMLALAQLPGNTGYAGRWSFRLWSSATPPSKADGRYEVTANSFVVKNDAGQVVPNSGFEVGAYPTGNTANESSDYRRAVDYGSRLDSMLAAKYDITLGNQESDSDTLSALTEIYDMEVGGYNSRDDNGGVVYTPGTTLKTEVSTKTDTSQYFGGVTKEILGMTQSYGYLIDGLKETLYSDGTVKVSFPVYNNRPLFVAVEVLDSQGNIVDTQLVDPKLLNTSVTEDLKEKLWDQWVDGKSGFKDSTISKETQIDINVPKGGSVRMSYSSSTAQLANATNMVIDTVFAVLGGALPDMQVSPRQWAAFINALANGPLAEGIKAIVNGNVTDVAGFGKKFADELLNPKTSLGAIWASTMAGSMNDAYLGGLRRTLEGVGDKMGLNFAAEWIVRSMNASSVIDGTTEDQRDDAYTRTFNPSLE